MDRRASRAVRQFVETGDATELEDEIKYDSNIFDDFHMPKIPKGYGHSETTFFVDGEHRLVSFITKIIPSPDWFIGIDSVELCKDGKWVEHLTLDLNPLDAGTDNGLTFTAPNWPTKPQELVEKITARYPRHFASSFFYPEFKHLPSIANVTITKVGTYTN